MVHREYTSTYQAKFVIEKKQMYVENANRALQDGVLTSDCTEPYPKNPIIADFFRNIGYADKLASGVRNLYKYNKIYSGKNPEFIEGDVFRIIVPLDEKFSVENTTQSTTQSASDGLEENILKLIREESTISQKEIADQLEMNQNTVNYYIRKMQKNELLVREGTNRKGQWIIREGEKPC